MHLGKLTGKGFNTVNHLHCHQNKNLPGFTWDTPKLAPDRHPVTVRRLSLWVIYSGSRSRWHCEVSSFVQDLESRMLSSFIFPWNLSPWPGKFSDLEIFFKKRFLFSLWKDWLEVACLTYSPSVPPLWSPFQKQCLASTNPWCSFNNSICWMAKPHYPLPPLFQTLAP